MIPVGTMVKVVAHTVGDPLDCCRVGAVGVVVEELGAYEADDDDVLIAYSVEIGDPCGPMLFRPHEIVPVSDGVKVLQEWDYAYP